MSRVHISSALRSLGRLPAVESAALERGLDAAVARTGAAMGSVVLLGPDGIAGAMTCGDVGTCPGDDTSAVRGCSGPDQPGPLLDRVLGGAAVRASPVTCGPRGCEPAFLGVPLCDPDGQVLGGLLVVREASGSSFGDAEETLLAGLAGQVAAELRSSRATLRVQDLERQLVARTAPAGPVPRLGLPDDLEPAEAVERILDSARAALGMELAFVSRVGNGYQRLAAMSGDVAAFGFELGVEVPSDEHYCQHMLDGEMHRTVPDTLDDPVARRLDVTHTARLRAYAGVPLRLPDGRVFGALCTTSKRPRPGLGKRDEEILEVLAAVLGEHVGRMEVRDAVRRRRILELRGLLAPGAIEIVAQPVVDLHSGRIVGVEALSRFPGRGGPAEVFADATSLGIGPDLELAAVAEALSLLDRLPAGRHLAVNVSPAVALDPRLDRLLYDVDCERVVLELTEHVAVDDFDALTVGLRRLRRWGVRLAVDDAGSGFASLRHLLSLAPEVIKLDLALTQGIDGDPALRALAGALVGFSTELGATLVAEGVETEAELATLRCLGVEQGQGYLLGRPVPLEEIDSGMQVAV